MKCLELTINIDLLSCVFMYNRLMRLICGTASREKIKELGVDMISSDHPDRVLEGLITYSH